MAKAKTILILGGGIGGQVVANELRRTLPREHRVTVIERELRHAFAPSFLWVMTGDRRPEQVTRDLRELVRPGVGVRHGDVRVIDLANRAVLMQAGIYAGVPATNAAFRWAREVMEEKET